MKLVLRFKLADIAITAGRYISNGDTELMEKKSTVLVRGYMTKNEVYEVAYWKSRRSAGHVKKNDEDYVKEVTRFAMGTKSERARVESLTLLDGVSWPIASGILHLFHSKLYPILDIRALWSVSVKKPSKYNFLFWWEYVEFCRRIAKSAGVDMRTLDRALWQYSKENQGPLT